MSLLVTAALLPKGQSHDFRLRFSSPSQVEPTRYSVHAVERDDLGHRATGVKTYGAEYSPYGEIQTETGTNPSLWSFVGLIGYQRDTASRLAIPESTDPGQPR